MIVLDTNVLSELIRSKPAVQVVEWVDGQDAGGLAITAVTVAELLYGVARLADGARKLQLAVAVRALVNEDFPGRVLPFDAAAAAHFAELVAERDRRGRPISIADGQIAAICQCRGARLATRNLRDFAEIDLELIDPWASG